MKVSKGRRPNTPPNIMECEVTDSEVECEVIGDRGLNQMLFQ